MLEAAVVLALVALYGLCLLVSWVRNRTPDPLGSHPENRARRRLEEPPK